MIDINNGVVIGIIIATKMVAIVMGAIIEMIIVIENIKVTGAATAIVDI